MSSNNDKYNGWTNRETWALSLWLSNDQGLYEMTRERVARAVEMAISNARHTGFGTTGPGTRFSSTQAWLESDLGRAYLARIAGGAVEDLWEEITSPSEDGDSLESLEAKLDMVRDVGSEYRVDWDEIGQHWLADAQEADSSADEIGRHWLEDVTENPVES